MDLSDTGLIALAISLLGTLIVSTWRVSSVTAVLLESVKQLQKNDDEIKGKLAALDAIPRIDTRLTLVESACQSMPRIVSDVDTLKADARHARELQRIAMRAITNNDTEPG